MSNIQEYRAQLAEIENAMMQLPQQRGLRVEEHFLPGVYIRQLFIPKDTILTGMIHKKECVNILASGVIMVNTETEGAKTLRSPQVFKSEAGSKRIGRTFTDVTWINVFSIDEDADIDNIVGEIAALEYSDPGIEWGDECQSLGSQ